MFRLDPADSDQARAIERLSNDTVVWLTTVSTHLRPQPSAVWFLWDGETVLVYSAGSARIKNLSRNSQVALNFNSDEHATTSQSCMETPLSTPKRPRPEMSPDIGLDMTKGSR